MAARSSTSSRPRARGVREKRSPSTASWTLEVHGGSPDSDWIPENNGISVIPPEMTDALVKMAQIMKNQLQILRNQATIFEKESTGVKAHYLALRKVRVRNFDGSQEPEEAERWLNELEANFKVMEVPEEVKPEVVVPFLVGDAGLWWNATASAYTQGGQVLTWAVFRKVFLDHYFPEALHRVKESQFFDLKQTENMSLMEYARKFSSLGYYAPYVKADEKLKLKRFMAGLNDRIRARLSAVPFEIFSDLYNRSIRVEADIRRIDEESGHKERPKLGGMN